MPLLTIRWSRLLRTPQHGLPVLFKFSVGRITAENCPFPWDISPPPPNTWFLGPTRVYRPVGISIGSAVFVDDVMFSHNGAVTRCLVEFARWRHSRRTSRKPRCAQWREVNCFKPPCYNIVFRCTHCNLIFLTAAYVYLILYRVYRTACYARCITEDVFDVSKGIVLMSCLTISSIFC